MCSFQKEGVRFALKHNGRALIADDMGTGKTVQVSLLSACGDVPPVWMTPNRIMRRCECAAYQLALLPFSCPEACGW